MKTNSFSGCRNLLECLLFFSAKNEPWKISKNMSDQKTHSPEPQATKPKNHEELDEYKQIAQKDEQSSITGSLSGRVIF